MLGRALSSLKGGPSYGPQSFTVDLLQHDVHGWTRGERAAELSIIPKRTRTWFAPYKPGSAQRIPPLVNAGYGREYANAERTRLTLVARARMFRDGLLYPTPRTAPSVDQTQPSTITTAGS